MDEIPSFCQLRTDKHIQLYSKNRGRFAFSSCRENYHAAEIGTCKECYEVACETEEELKREIEELKAKVAFLRSWSPLDHQHCGFPAFSDVVLVAADESHSKPVSVPAHRAVLVLYPAHPSVLSSCFHFSSQFQCLHNLRSLALGCEAGNTVAVAGIESTGRPAARVFFSAPIVERWDNFTLKTEDGIFVLLKGLINKQQTCANGFSEEVFKHFLFGFPFNWEECAEKCFQQGIGSEATADADLNPGQSTVTKMGNATVKLKQKLWKDSDCNNRSENMDEAQNAVTELDDQTIDSVEERSFKDARSDAQNHNKDSHATVDCQDRDTYMNTDLHDSNAGLMEEGVRYHLRNREVRYSEAEGDFGGKHVYNVKGKSSSLKTMLGDDTSTIPLVASLENSQTPDMTPLLEKSSKEKAEHPNFAESGGLNGASHAKNTATITSMSISGEAPVICNSMHKINEAQESHRHDDTEPIPKNAGKDKNLISDHSPGGKPRQSKIRKRNERMTTQTNIIMTRSLLRKTVENADAFAVSHSVGLENSVKSGGVAVRGKNIENPTGRGEGENKQTPGRLRSENVKIKKRSTREDSSAVETDVHFSPQDADKLENSTSDNNCGEKSHLSKKGRKQRSGLIRTTLNNMNLHDSAKPTLNTCTSKAESHSKAAGGVAVRANNIENPTGRGEGENKQTPGRLRSENVKIKKRSTREDSAAVETDVHFSPQDAFKLENSTSDNISGEKSHLSKMGRKQTSGLTKTTSNNKNFHDSVRPTLKACTSKAESHSKAAVAERERKTSQGSTPKLQSRRKLDYDQETTCTPEGENKTPTSQSSVLRTSRSGRVLLPTMEFWRNQLPIYDADHGVSAIREGSTILKVKTQKGKKSCIKES